MASEKTNVATPEFQEKIASILLEKGLTAEIKQVTCSQAFDMAGLHIASSPHTIEVEFKGETKKLHLFFKKSPTFKTPDLVEFGKGMVEKEGTFLVNLIKEVNEFVARESGFRGFLTPHFPVAYYYDAEGILMENLYETGFVMHEKGKLHGHTAAMAVCRAFAKLHGACWAWVDDIGGPREAQKRYPLFFEEILESKAGFHMMETCIGNTVKTITVLMNQLGDEVDGKNYMEKYGKHLEPGTSVMGDILKKYKEPCHIKSICQTDTQTTNMMFKPDYASVKLVDFQVNRYTCPLIDIAEYMSTCLKPSVRKEWKTLFSAYYLTLKETVEMTGKEFPITLNDVLEDFVSKHEIGLAKGLHMIFAEIAHDTYNVLDSDDNSPETYGKVVQQWIQNNPDKVKGCATACAELVDDFVAIQPYKD